MITNLFGRSLALAGFIEQVSGQSKVLAIYKEGQTAKQLAAGEVGMIILDKTPFYAESGGQVGDTGLLTGPAGVFAVQDTQKRNP